MRDIHPALILVLGLTALTAGAAWWNGWNPFTWAIIGFIGWAFTMAFLDAWVDD